MKSTVNKIMVALSAFVLVCYLPYLALVLVNGETFFSCFIAFSVVVAALVPTLLFVKYSDRLNKALRVLRTVYICGMAFYFITFSAFFAYIGVGSLRSAEDTLAVFAEQDVTSTKPARDVVIVFGCRAYGYTPGIHLKNRLEAAVTLLEGRPDSVCVVSGGQGENETVPEAEAMRAYLENRGIAPERIYKEDESHNTYENIVNTKNLIDNLGIDYDRIIGVSSDFHIPRIEYLFDYYDIGLNAEIETVASRSPGFGYYFVSVVREYMAYVKLFLVTVL